MAPLFREGAGTGTDCEEGRLVAAGWKRLILRVAGLDPGRLRLAMRVYLKINCIQQYVNGQVGRGKQSEQRVMEWEVRGTSNSPMTIKEQ